jgi:cysteine desulfurase
MALDLAGVAVSTGAACAAGAIEPSHVLRAMGLAMPRIEGSLRLSVGRGTTDDDVRTAATVISEAVARQRALRTRPAAARR